MGREDRFPVWEAALLAGVAATFAAGLAGVYLSMPHSDYSFLKLPRNLQDLQVLTDHLEDYTSDYTVQVLVGYCAVYIFMQTFMIPGTIFMSLLAGALFGQLGGVALVVFAATAGASSCYFLSKLIGKPLVFSLWPDKLRFFQKQVAKRREKLLNYMLFLRVTPTLPNTFINLASPIVDVPYHIFFLATLIGLIPAAYVTVRAGIALGDLSSLSDLYDPQSIALLFLIGFVSVTPTLLDSAFGGFMTLNPWNLWPDSGQQNMAGVPTYLHLWNTLWCYGRDTSRSQHYESPRQNGPSTETAFVCSV